MPQSGASGADARSIAAHIPLHLRLLERRTANLYTFFTRRFLPWPSQILSEANMDVLYIGLIVVFVALSIALVHGCEKLRRKPQ